jgi:iron complex transport system permease protein
MSYRIDRRAPFIFLVLLVFTIVVASVSIAHGQYNISPLDVIRTVLNLNQDHPDAANMTLVVHTFRLPRVVLSFLIGMALAVSGTLMQGLTRNPLADPYLLGVSSGASLAAVAIIVMGKSLFGQSIPVSTLPWAAFAGATITALVIYALAWKNGSSSPIRLILIGVALQALFGALITVMLLFGDIRDVQQAYVWMTGSVYGRNWEHVHAIGGWLLLFLPAALLGARHLNILGLGDETARGLGVRVERSRLVLLLISVALAAAAVAVAGTIGFVGLVAPHAARRLVGPSHEGLLPVSALLGSALLVLADFLGRAVIAPSELPIGLVTAAIGAPYFLFLFYRYRNA